MTEQVENKDPQIQEETITSVTDDLKEKGDPLLNDEKKVETSDNLPEEITECQTNGHKENSEEAKVENVTSTEESGEANPADSEPKDEKAKKTEDEAIVKDETLGSTVAKHYNEIPAATKETRKDSRIFYLRNFNNWVKSVIINEFMEKVKRRKRTSDDINVLDLACGKGGDLLKWDKSKVDHVILADIAATSIEQCKERYAKLQRDRRGGRYKERVFTSELFAADCTKEVLSEKYKKKDIKLDMSSCQFAFHYSFESYEQADIMLKNACENLRVGGYFVGTTPDANKLVKRIKECKADSFGNSVFNIKPDSRDQFPLFGAKYMFYLEGVVDCPEFLVHMPTLEAMAEKYSMKLVWKKNFHEIFKGYQRQHSSLLNKMNALEQYPAPKDKTLVGGSESQYKAARDYIDKKGCKQTGTLSADEWEVAGLYLAFAFEKVADVAKENRDRESRKRQRHSGERRHSSSSSSKRTKKDSGCAEEVYEVKDEFYEPEYDVTASSTTESKTSEVAKADVPIEDTSKTTEATEESESIAEENTAVTVAATSSTVESEVASADSTNEQTYEASKEEKEEPMESTEQQQQKNTQPQPEPSSSE